MGRSAVASLSSEGGKTWLENPLFHRQKTGIFDFRRFHMERQIQVDCDVLFRHLADFADACHMRNSEKFRKFGSDLRRVAVGGLFPAEDQIASARGGDALRQRVGGRQHVGSSEPAVRKNDPVVHAHHKGFADHGLRLRRTHGHYRDLRSDALFEAQCRFQRA